MSLCLYDAKILGSTIKKARQKKHLTQAACAELLDFSLSFQKDVERGRFSQSLENFTTFVEFLIYRLMHAYFLIRIYPIPIARN